jgi:hypothetical protein
LDEQDIGSAKVAYLLIKVTLYASTDAVRQGDRRGADEYSGYREKGPRLRT